MINSFVPIDERYYFIYDTRGVGYYRAIYTESFTKEKFTKTTDYVSLEKVMEIVNNPKIVSDFIRQLLPIEKLFWEHAPDEMKQALTYSFYHHMVKKDAKIANMEIGDWSENKFFREHEIAALKNANITNFLKPRTMLNALIASTGKHQRNLRMGHVHLTKDVIEGKEVWGIHWDAGFARIAPEIVRHWIFDDMGS